MPGDEVTVDQLCGKCGSRVSAFTVKKDNLMLTSSEQIWCPSCGKNTPEIRDISGRQESITREQSSYPKPGPASLPRNRRRSVGPSEPVNWHSQQRVNRKEPRFRDNDEHPET